MRKLLNGMFLLIGLHGWGQVDTLIVKDLREAADIVFAELDTSLYHRALIDRSFSSSEIVNRQLKGQYDQVHSVMDFFDLYYALRQSYIDTVGFLGNEELLHFVEDVFEENELNSVDELILPFGFVLHNISRIDSTKLNSSYFSNNNNRLVPTGSEADYYQITCFKSGALLEFYPESGYTNGKLQYIPELINVSADIQNLELDINVGNGFQPFNAIDNLIQYDRTRDSIIGQVAFRYEVNQILFYDTLSFYLTTKGEVREKSTETWWSVGTAENSTTIKFDIGYMHACDYQYDIVGPRRPVIIVPPYRPAIQSMSMQKYYDQFNVGGLFTKLAEMGYDVYFIKLKPGNKSLELAAQALSEFITKLNVLKQSSFPNESWENIVIGYSMGGQIARYALKKMEKEHMMWGTPHHHTRLYIPFDSPHLGANIPMFAQAVYQDLKHLNIFAGLSYLALDDEASRDMSISHINGSIISITDAGVGSPKVHHILPGITIDRKNFLEDLQNTFTHDFTNTTDLRRTFPSFTRNIAISTGSNSKDYTQLFGLQPGQLLFSQSTIGYFYGGTAYKLRRLYAAKRAYDYPVFRNKEQMLTFLIPITYLNREYRTYYADEWDMAQGGYKDEFYDKMTGAVRVLRLGTFGIGQKHYDNHMSFLPMVSALAINKNIWQLGNLHYDTKNEGLMYNQFNSNVQSDTYGYPNLGHPSNHFNITPFEAIYCDPQTYEHIKLQESISENIGDQNNNNPIYLAYITQFMLDEIEAKDVFLQNKVIGKNHVTWVSNYKYRAWYKAKNRLTIGNIVTPKTDPGDYIIEKSGDITVYAGKEIHIKPGFHAQSGSDFHAFIHWEDCIYEYDKNSSTSGSNTNQSESDNNRGEVNNQTSSFDEDFVRIFPNPSHGEITLLFNTDVSGEFTIFSTLGELMVNERIPENRKRQLILPRGHYLIRIQAKDGRSVTKQIIVL